MALSFAGKRVLVTGASKGIGRATAMRLVDLGASVVALGRDRGELESLAGDVQPVVADAGDACALRATLDAEVGAVDYLVNNAGVALNAPLLEASAADWDATFGVNVRGALVCAQFAAASMIGRGVGGAIVNVSSQASMVALDGHAAYCASKAALDALTRQLALELGPHGIRANSVNPTVTLTEMAAREWSDEARAGPMLDRIPMGRFAECDDVVDAVAYLLSDGAGLVSGAHLPVDGGFLAAPFNVSKRTATPGKRSLMTAADRSGAAKLPPCPTARLASGDEMPVLGLGTFTGTRFTQRAEPGTMRKTVKTWLAAGGTMVDCASNYLNEAEIGDGLAEAVDEGIVADAGDVWLTTKLNNPYHHPDAVRPALEQSLRDLRVGSVDLFLMHWPTAFVPVPMVNEDATTRRGFAPEYEPDLCSTVTGEVWENTHWKKTGAWPPHLARNVSIHDTWAAMVACRDAGLCRNVGVANFGVQLLHELVCNGETPAVVQCESHPYLQQTPLVDHCRNLGIQFQAYSPLGYGEFKGEHEIWPLGDAAILGVAAKHGVSAAQVCLRWTYQRGVCTMPMTIKESEMRQNLDIFNFELDDEDNAAIAKLEQRHHYLRPEDWYGLPLWD